jgi:hypothetical protein
MIFSGFFFTSCKHKTAVEQEREATIELVKDNDLEGQWSNKANNYFLRLQIQRVDLGNSGKPYDRVIYSTTTSLISNAEMVFAKTNDTLTIMDKSYSHTTNCFYLNGRMYAKIDRRKPNSLRSISINPPVWVTEELFKSKQFYCLLLIEKSGCF